MLLYSYSSFLTITAQPIFSWVFLHALYASSSLFTLASTPPIPSKLHAKCMEIMPPPFQRKKKLYAHQQPKKTVNQT